MNFAKYKVQLSTEKKYSSKYEYKYEYEYSIPDGSIMQVKSIAECSLGAFCNTFDLH